MSSSRIVLFRPLLASVNLARSVFRETKLSRSQRALGAGEPWGAYNELAARSTLECVAAGGLVIW